MKKKGAMPMPKMPMVKPMMMPKAHTQMMKGGGMKGGKKGGK